MRSTCCDRRCAHLCQGVKNGKSDRGGRSGDQIDRLFDHGLPDQSMMALLSVFGNVVRFCAPVSVMASISSIRIPPTPG